MFFTKNRDNILGRENNIVKSISLFAFNGLLIRWILEASLEEFPFSSYTLHHWPIYALINIISIIIVIAAFNIILNNIALSSCIVIVIACCISLINYYTIMWHGSVVTIQDIASIKTAFGVLGNYKFRVDKVVILILMMTIFSLLFNYVTNHLLKKNNSTLMQGSYAK